MAYIDTGTRTHAHSSRHEKKSSFSVPAPFRDINNKHDMFNRLAFKFIVFVVFR